MDVEAVLDRLMQAGVSVWLDQDGKLRIDKGAPVELKDLVREHKQALLDLEQALLVMNTAGVRIQRLPLGILALAYPPGTDLERIRWAARILGMDSMPLVINDEGLRWISYDEWRQRHGASATPRQPEQPAARGRRRRTA